MCSFMSLPLAEAAGDVVLGAAVARVGEDLAGRAGLHQLTHVEEGGLLRDAGGLGHRVGDDDDAGYLADSALILTPILCFSR